MAARFLIIKVQLADIKLIPIKITNKTPILDPNQRIQIPTGSKKQQPSSFGNYFIAALAWKMSATSRFLPASTFLTATIVI